MLQYVQDARNANRITFVTKSGGITEFPDENWSDVRLSDITSGEALVFRPVHVPTTVHFPVKLEAI